MKNQLDVTENKNIEDPIYYNTREVAEMLALSRGTVQKMVEQGTLQAWKTSGGHRRILGSSVESFLKNRKQNTFSTQPSRLSILVVEDDPALQKLYQLTIAEWDMPIDLNIVGDGLSGLVHIARHYPDILIADLRMPGVDGFEMIDTLRKDHLFNKMDIIVVTGLSKADISSRVWTPKGVTIFHKPVPFHEIHGYVSAKLASIQRNAELASS